MIRTSNIGGFFIFLLTISLLWFGIVVINKWCLFYWFYEDIVAKRWLSILPLTKIGTVLFVVFNSLGYLASVSHLRAALWDPGIITPDIKAPGEMPENEIKGCKRCNLIWKPMRAHHCSECNVCIFKMDHHCPWINSWVGIRNTKYFFLFTLYTGIGALLSIAILVTCFILLLREESEVHTKKKYYPVGFFLCVWVFIESILFSFFTIELVSEQLESFQDNETYVDSLKELHGPPLTLFDSFFIYIGEDWLFWLLPTRPVLIINYWERLFTDKQLISKEHLKLTPVEYDPSHKQKGIEHKNSRIDKIYFVWFTALSLATCYYLAL